MKSMSEWAKREIDLAKEQEVKNRVIKSKNANNRFTKSSLTSFFILIYYYKIF